MGQPLDVDTDTLRALSTALTGEADRITGINPTPAIDATAHTMPGSTIGAATSRAGTPLLHSYRASAEILREMATTAQANAHEYDTTDRVFRRDLNTAGGR